MDTKKIGDKIAGARKKNNLSQAQLAEQLFISPQAVGKWERGESLPDIITLIRIAGILGTDLNYFSDNFSSKTLDIEPGEIAVNPELTDQTVQKKKGPAWDMSRGNWVDADFSGLKNLHDKFSSSNMQRCKFIGSDMSQLVLKGNNVHTCDFSGSDFSNSRIHKSNLFKNQFKECSLRETEFSESYITGCDFTGADLSGAMFTNGGIEKCVMDSAIIRKSSFKGTVLADIVFEGTIEDCSFEYCSFIRVTFRNAILKNTFFKNKNLKRIRFIECQADRLTYAFLKNGNAAMSGITLINE
jgi:uncharacterized protein YjbI with pentapeptide repeats